MTQLLAAYPLDLLISIIGQSRTLNTTTTMYLSMPFCITPLIMAFAFA